MKKLILLEGADDIIIKNIMERMSSILYKKNYKYISTMFPKYNEKSGILANRHINEYPKPDLSKVYYNLNDMRLNKGEILFISNRVTGKLQLVEIECKFEKGREFEAIVHDCISGEKITLNKESNYVYYNCIMDNIINWGCKASHTTKALFFTIDRNVWFTNNKSYIDNCDYLILNRSHLSNFLYRTTKMETEEDFLEYIISIYRIEIIANSLQDVDIKSYFLKTKNFELEEEFIKSYYLYNRKDLDENFDVDRTIQYTKTIYNNYDHLQDLINRTKKKYPNFYNKYSRFVETELINLENSILFTPKLYRETESIAEKLLKDLNII